MGLLLILNGPEFFYFFFNGVFLCACVHIKPHMIVYL